MPLKQCINLQSFIDRGYEITFKSLSLDTSIARDEVIINLKYPITIIKDDLTGKLVNPKSQSELAQAILLLLKNEAKRKELADEALREIRRKYAVEVCSRKYKDVFRFLKTKLKC